MVNTSDSPLWVDHFTPPIFRLNICKQNHRKSRGKYVNRNLGKGLGKHPYCADMLC